MRENDWQSVKKIFLAALEIPAPERARFVAETGGENTEIIKEVESLLAAHESDTGFIETPAVALTSILCNAATNGVGKTFGNYKIIREIGAGGMGAVFLAERSDGEFEQQVAIKIIRQAIAESELINRFKRERQILASLNHPNIAKLLDGGVSADGSPFLAMEFIEGEAITKFAARENLNLEERLKLFLKVCSAVQYAHQNLTVHRDIKPSNILVTKDKEPKLLDFGLAKLLDENLANDTEQTQTAFRALTPAYASPEQLKNEPITTASDIYSLGIVFYELLTGDRPFHFEGKSLDEIIKSATQFEPPLPSAIQNSKFKTGDLRLKIEDSNGESPNPKSKIQNPKSLKGDLDNIALMALRKEPTRRYQSVAAFADDIERYLQGLPVAARPNTFSYRAEKFVRRNKTVVFAAVFIFMAIVTGLIVSLRQAENAGRQRDLAQGERAKAERINKFLQEMLSFSNQSITSVSPVAQTRDVTVNQMLDQITPQIESELADEPEVRAQVLRTIGSSYASQGFYDKAEKNLRESLKIQTEIFGEDNAETAATMFELGALAFRQVKLDEANRLLEKNAAFYRRRQADAADFNPAKLAGTLDSLGTVKFYSGDTKSSVALLNEALQIAVNTNLQGNERLILASIQTNLGGVLIRSGEPDKGETLLRQSLALYNEISDIPRWEKGATLIMLGELYNSKNQPDETLKFLTESEQIYRRTLGDRNAYLAYNLYQQTLALNQKRDFKNAEAKAREALEIYQAVLPNEHLILSAAMAALGMVLTKNKKAAEAENYLRPALAFYLRQPTKNFAEIAQIKNSLSENLTMRHRFAEAEKISRQTVRENGQKLDDQNALTNTAIKDLNEIREK